MHHLIIIQEKTSQIIYKAFYAIAYPNDWAFDLKFIILKFQQGKFSSAIFFLSSLGLNPARKA